MRMRSIFSQGERDYNHIVARAALGLSDSHPLRCYGIPDKQLSLKLWTR
jgi:hypothetical protein